MWQANDSWAGYEAQKYFQLRQTLIARWFTVHCDVVIVGRCNRCEASGVKGLNCSGYVVEKKSFSDYRNCCSHPHHLLYWCIWPVFSRLSSQHLFSLVLKGKGNGEENPSSRIPPRKSET